MNDKCYYYKCENIPRFSINVIIKNKRKRIYICYLHYYKYLRQEIKKDGSIITFLAKDKNHNSCNYKVSAVYDIELGIHKLIKGSGLSISNKKTDIK